MIQPSTGYQSPEQEPNLACQWLDDAMFMQIQELHRLHNHQDGLKLEGANSVAMRRTSVLLDAANETIKLAHECGLVWLVELGPCEDCKNLPPDNARTEGDKILHIEKLNPEAPFERFSIAMFDKHGNDQLPPLMVLGIHIHHKISRGADVHFDFGLEHICAMRAVHPSFTPTSLNTELAMALDTWHKEGNPTEPLAEILKLLPHRTILFIELTSSHTEADEYADENPLPDDNIKVPTSPEAQDPCILAIPASMICITKDGGLYIYSIDSDGIVVSTAQPGLGGGLRLPFGDIKSIKAAPIVHRISTTAE